MLKLAVLLKWPQINQKNFCGLLEFVNFTSNFLSHHVQIAGQRSHVTVLTEQNLSRDHWQKKDNLL